MDNLDMRRSIEIMKDRIDDQDKARMELIDGFQKELDSVKKNAQQVIEKERLPFEMEMKQLEELREKEIKDLKHIFETREMEMREYMRKIMYLLVSVSFSFTKISLLELCEEKFP